VGIDVHAARLLFHARNRGVSFERTATIGRQGLYLTDKMLRRVLESHGYAATRQEAQRLMLQRDGYAEPILEVLGARDVESFDASDYEGATHVVDFNLPIDGRFRNRYSVVIDAGTLEHVFNFLVSISNCMQMVEMGGHFVCVTPTNNFGGHGFYQFSMELYFRIFSPGNGFKVKQMLVSEGNPRAPWYEVTDPETVGDRMDLVNSSPTSFMMIAEKIAAVEPFLQPPQQSDYVFLWTPRKPPQLNRGFARSVYASLPSLLQTGARRARDIYRRTRRRINPFDPRFCQRIEIRPEALCGNRAGPSPDAGA